MLYLQLPLVQILPRSSARRSPSLVSFLKGQREKSRTRCDTTRLRRCDEPGPAAINFQSAALICCAVPSVLVLLGMGTAAASLLSDALCCDDVLCGSATQRRRSMRSRRPTTCGEVGKLSRIIL